ncbi:MAG: hypothetical protein Ct9H300mP1_37130 [Planctomycetaceae bacterium]|nr:MAG: hypothetical protein Ct9H300mP1_37130 [Planctomycetaceae bacterium]
MIDFLSEGITDTSGRGRVYLHHDRVGGRLRARKSARLSACTNAGAIPDIGSYRVVTEDDLFVGTLDEDFAIESQAGDVFLLGNTSWRIHHVRGERVTVSDAGGAPPTIPFWRGEAPGRTWELSEEVSRLREEIAERIGGPGGEESERARRLEQAKRWVAEETLCNEHAAGQVVDYIASQQAAVGLVPSGQRVLFERFFDESGGMQVVIHAPFGSRINRAWGLALRKRFCRSFDFELQATADDDGFILSLGPQHSFPLESLFGMLGPHNARNPCSNRPAGRPGLPTPLAMEPHPIADGAPPARLQEGASRDPEIPCRRPVDGRLSQAHRLPGEHHRDHEIPDHPLVQQTMHDCLHGALGLPRGPKQVLERIDSGEIELVGRDTREPSPFTWELLNANPYAFLDGGKSRNDGLGPWPPAAACRSKNSATSVVSTPRQSARSSTRPGRRYATPTNCTTCCSRGSSSPQKPLPGLDRFGFYELVETGRATRVILADDHTAWVAAERFPAGVAMYETPRSTHC